MSSVFKFKRFEVDQSGCAMKINTDGVLLALLASAEAPLRILDIGTGTGVMALILAQRYETADVEAVEIDEMAAATAGRNFRQSEFAGRLKAHHGDVAEYIASGGFDLIVSNPPYFVNDLKNPEEKKGIARHAGAHFFEMLIAKVASLLCAEGRFWVVLPVKQAQLLAEMGEAYGLTLVRQIHLHSDVQKPEFRRIICLSRMEETLVDETFYIYESEKVYTSAYRSLLKDFFLAY